MALKRERRGEAVDEPAREDARPTGFIEMNTPARRLNFPARQTGFNF